MPTLRLVEVIQYVTDTDEFHQHDNEKHHTLLPHTDVRCSISAKLCMMLEEVSAIISSPQCFSGTVNSLAKTHE